MFKKRPAGRHLAGKVKTQHAPAPTPKPGPTSAPSHSPVRTRTDTKAENAYAILTVMESRLQSPFG